MHVHHDHSRRIIFAVGLAATLVALFAHHSPNPAIGEHPPARLATTH
ncbi:MAG: hypothetical protein OEL76_00390 [Siculibacillus sp.]|nr:hypothetical protein [Siculibacillus sp.]